MNPQDLGESDYPGMPGDPAPSDTGCTTEGATMVVALPSTPEVHEPTLVGPSGSRSFHDSTRREFYPALVSSDILPSTLERLRKKYRVPLEFELEVPSREGRVCSPSRGRIAMYQALFVAGMRLPLYQFFLDLCRSLGLAPYTLMPNS